MTDRYQVRKHTISVKIRSSGPAEEKIQLFLGETAESHAGPERPADVFNSAREFVVARSECGGICFLRRDSVSTVAMASEDEFGEGLASSDLLAGDLQEEQQITIVLEDGTSLEGWVRYELPESNRRLQDFLNAEAPFLTLYQAGQVLLVNKRRVARVELS